MRETTHYGSGVKTGAGAIDLVILTLPVGQEFTENEVIDEVRKRSLNERGAVANHLRALRKRGHIQQSPCGWKRVN